MNKPEFMNWAIESVSEKPLAVVVMGNPKYIEDPRLKTLATALYCQIKMFLQVKYTVKFDAGEPFTHPDIHAKLWVGHSRGIDRLRFAPKGVKTIELQTQDHDQVYASDDERGRDPLHYKLSAQDVKALMAA